MPPRDAATIDDYALRLPPFHALRFLSLLLQFIATSRQMILPLITPLPATYAD